jgi:hypothetical protein
MSLAVQAVDTGQIGDIMRLQAQAHTSEPPHWEVPSLHQDVLYPSCHRPHTNQMRDMSNLLYEVSLQNKSGWARAPPRIGSSLTLQQETMAVTQSGILPGVVLGIL